ncbi:hypothetical protein AVEN_126011-1 [Araneus ventricosus]|uniref:Uncharacterized protein n=1 Tax=Araneus ventricosus TaxID=182803 RepID=A0A4Y2T2W6_ARAVE|nr:hypothetical protein AVEN_126011-1 [Araneus ventricosus]
MENEKGGEEPFRRLELGFRLRSSEKSCVISSDLKSRINSDLGSKHREIGNFLNSRLIKLRALLAVSCVTLIGGNYPSCDEPLPLWTTTPVHSTGTK